MVSAVGDGPEPARPGLADAATPPARMLPAAISPLPPPAPGVAAAAATRQRPTASRALRRRNSGTCARRRRSWTSRPGYLARSAPGAG
jgi:hypothetical protein